MDADAVENYRIAAKCFGIWKSPGYCKSPLAFRFLFPTEPCRVVISDARTLQYEIFAYIVQFSLDIALTSLSCTKLWRFL